jgi:phytoene dehydrogenase-like protein
MTNHPSNFDAIIVGAGHNGLVTAAYLAKAGLKVAVFEKRDMVGGCAITEEPWPGFKVSTLSYVNSLFRPEIIEDLRLKDFGFELLPRVPSSFTPFPDGRSLLLGPNQEQNQKEIAKFSSKDAENYPKYEKYLDRLAQIIEPLMILTPPNPAQLAFTDLTSFGLYGLKHYSGLKDQWAEMLRLLTGSATDLLDHWFESEALKITLATDAVIGANASPSMPGTAYVLFHHVMGECNGVRGIWGYMRSGMGGLTQSLARSCQSLGVEIFTSNGVLEILTDQGNAIGILDESGKDYKSKIVASSVDATLTFRRLISGSALPSAFLKDVDRINYDSASVKINLAIDELPDFSASPGVKPSPWHRGTIHICPSFQVLNNAYADSVAGRPSQVPILECTIPSVLDETLAPEGKHIMNIFSQYGPYQLAEGLDWKDEKEKYANRVLDTLFEYAPNLKGRILNRQIITPVDLEQDYGLTGGSIFQGRMSLDQMFSMRPVPGYADYTTPIKGLYLCGSATHPGGGVMGTPGLNAARRILKTLKRKF